MKKKLALLAAAITLAVPGILPVQDNVASVEAASVKISAKKLSLIKGQSKTLKISGTKSKVTWSSSKKSIATVSSKGKVTAKRAGTATITAKVNGKKYTCKVTVETPKLNKTTLSLKVKKTYRLKVSGTKQKVTWSSKNKSVATVNSGGVVTGKKAGTTTITAKVGGKKYTCKVIVGKATIPVTNVKLNKTSITLTEGDTYKLKASVSPSNATDKTVKWTSDNNAVATVDSNGNVKAVSAGAALISVEAGLNIDSCIVTVEPKYIDVTEITLNTSSLTMKVGDASVLEATVTPSDATDQTIEWSSNNTNVARVYEGRVVAVSPGTAIITATAGKKYAQCIIQVEKRTVEVSSVNLNAYELTLEESDSFTLTATVLPTDATDKTVVWSSSNTNVARVNNGEIIAMSPGTATITAKSGSKSAKCTVAVKAKNIAVTGIILNTYSMTLTEGDTSLLTATVSPENATDKSVVWSSNNDTIVSVDANGKVTAIAPGTARISATCGGRIATCDIVVNKKKPTVLENYAFLADYIEKYGGTNSSGNKFIKLVDNYYDSSCSYAIVYEANTNQFDLISILVTPEAQQSYRMVIKPTLMEQLNPKFTLIYNNYYIGCSANAILYPATYTDDTDLLFRLESSVGGLGESNIQGLGNTGLQLSFIGWSRLILTETGMYLSDLGFLSY